MLLHTWRRLGATPLQAMRWIISDRAVRVVFEQTAHDLTEVLAFGCCAHDDFVAQFFRDANSDPRGVLRSSGGQGWPARPLSPGGDVEAGFGLGGDALEVRVVEYPPALGRDLQLITSAYSAGLDGDVFERNASLVGSQKQDQVLFIRVVRIERLVSARCTCGERSPLMRRTT